MGALSADYGLSLLTLLAFAATYPLAIVLVVALRRAHPQDASSAAAGEGGEGAPSADAVPTVDDALGAGVDAVAARFELTPREREILATCTRPYSQVHRRRAGHFREHRVGPISSASTRKPVSTPNKSS